MIARKRASLSAAEAALAGVMTLRTAKQRFDSRPHTRPTVLKLTCHAHERVSETPGLQRQRQQQQQQQQQQLECTHTSATLASHTPKTMGRVERTTGRDTAAPMQADTSTCTTISSSTSVPIVAAFAAAVTVNAGSSAFIVCANDASTPQKDQLVNKWPAQ